MSLSRVLAFAALACCIALALAFGMRVGIPGAMIQHWLCYRRYPESRCIALFESPEQVAAPHEIDTAATPIEGEAAQTQGTSK